MGEPVIRYREEKPRVIDELDAPLRRLVERVARWIEDPERRALGSRAWVAGIYGGRGTGKTSFLQTLFKVLKKPDSSRGTKPQCVLPNVESAADGIFAPADAGQEDDLLFLLLDHLKHRSPTGSTVKGFDEARLAQVRQKDSARFLQYAQDISPSEKEIPRLLMEVHNDIAGTTSSIKTAFHDILSSLRTADQTLVLLVDDLDLQPHRALELLELVYLFMSHPGVVVLLAADRDLLINSVDRALEHRGLKSGGLANALVTKYVPYQWMLPVPSVSTRLDDLWHQDQSSPPELPRWWSEEFRVLYRSEHDRKALAQTLLGPLLPRSYRGLKTLHNRLLSLRDELSTDEAADSALASLVPHHLVEELQLAREFVAPFMSMVAAIDVRFPELGVLTILRESPSELLKSLDRLGSAPIAKQLRQLDTMTKSELLVVADAVDRVASSIGSRHQPDDDDRETAPLDRLRPPYFEARRLGEVKQALFQLAESWKDLRQRAAAAPVETRLLAVSMMTDALAMIEPQWIHRFAREDVENWHIDLRPFVAAGKGVPEELRGARREAYSQIKQRRVLGFAGAVELHVKARLSFVLWLGWELRYLRPVTAYNVYGDDRIPFDGPPKPLRFADNDVYWLLEPVPSDLPPARSREAIVLVDLTGRSTADQLGTFFIDRATGEQPSVGDHRYRLLGPLNRRIEPPDIVPIIEDVLELLGRLRRDRGVERFHLAFAGPDVAAFFLGQQLNAIGRVSLYEFYSDHYEYVFDLEEARPAPP